MWIGTENGLNRYDGLTFRVYRPGQKKYKLSHEHINDVEEDAHGQLWIATWHGLNVINPITDSLHVFSTDEQCQSKTKIASNLIWDSYIDKKGKIWLALDVRDLCYYDQIQKEFVSFPWLDYVKSILPQHASSYKAIHKIIRKTNSEIWLGTTLGLFSFNVEKKSFKHYGGEAPEDFVSIRYDSTLQRVYFAQKKLYVYDLTNDKLREIPQKTKDQLINLKSASTLLLPTLDGLQLIDKEKEQVNYLQLDEKEAFTFQHEKVSAVFTDLGITWIGTSKGIGLYDSHSDIFPFVPVFPDTLQSSNGNVFYVMDNDEGTYYASSYNRNSLIVMDGQIGKSKEITSIQGRPLKFCTKIMEDSKHRLWVLSAESIFISDDAQRTFSLFPFPSKSKNYRFVDMIEDAEGNFWFASLRHDVFHYNPKTNAWKQIPKDPKALFVDRPTCLLSDPSHHAVWIGDYSFGVFRHDLITKEYKYFRANAKDPHSIQSSLISALAIDKQGDVWVATTSGGVSKYSQEKKEFTTYSMETGLPENTIHSLQSDLNGNLWLASNKGLTCIKPTGEMIKHYDKNSGLPSNNFSTPFSTNKKGEILIGVANGYVKFHPDSLALTSPDFPVVITSVHQGNQSIDLFIHQKFSYKQNEFTFQFAALTYSQPRQTTYFYQLKGYEKEWINADNNYTARYTNLNDGQYTFLVKAIDYTGKPSMNEASVSFRITPPFWKENWFIALSLLGIALSFYLYVRSLQRKIKSQRTLNRLATSLYGQNSIERVFAAITAACSESNLFENCAIYQYDTGQNILTQKSVSKNSTDALAQKELVQSIIKKVIEKREAILANDNQNNSQVAAPILIEDKVFAIIVATHTKKNQFGKWHISMLKEIASICNVKIERYFAEEQIRSKVSRDLHDDIGSALSSINILSQVALVEKNGNAQDYLQRIGDQSARIMEDIGDMVWSINPRNDSMSQIVIRMREFATEIFEPTTVEYHFSENITEGFTLGADQRKNLFLIFKEAINNAAKYSRASRVEINLHQHDHALIMRIKDNGQGFDEQKIKAGNGLRNQRERADEINGKLILKSVVGEGTEVELQLPIA